MNTKSFDYWNHILMLAGVTSPARNLLVMRFSFILLLSVVSHHFVNAQQYELQVENDYVKRYMDEVFYQYGEPSVIGDHLGSTSRTDYPRSVEITLPEVHTAPEFFTIICYDEESHHDSIIFKVPTSCHQAELCNFIPMRTYRYEIFHDEELLEKGSIVTKGKVRMLKIDGTVCNVRDLGGWMTTDGYRIRYGKLFRGSELNNTYQVTQEGIDELRIVGVAAELDLRAPYNEGSNYSALGFKDASSAMDDEVPTYYYSANSGQLPMHFEKESYLNKWTEEFRFIVKSLRAGHGIYVHCVFGKDRTGYLCFLLEGLLGVSYSDLMKEYELSCFCFGKGDATSRKDSIDKVIGIIEGLEGQMLRDKFNTFFVNTLHISQDDIDDFRRIMLESPETTESGISAISLDDVKNAGLCVLEVTTVNGEEPKGQTISHPLHQESFNITYLNKVPCRLVLSKNGDTLYDSGEYEKGESGATIRVNGNTSAYYSDSLNMPYKLKLERKADLLCRGDEPLYADKHWRLLKDATSLNTIVALELSKMLHMEWTSSYIPCNVIINGDYRGCYLLMESLERNSNCRVNCDKETGAIIERDPYWWKEDRYFSSKWYCLDTESSYRWTWKYPDADELTDETEQYMQQYINDMEESFDVGNYQQYIDLTSWAKWVLAHDILGTWDSGGANMYFKKSDNTANSVLEMPCIWDFDSSYKVPAGGFSRPHSSTHAYFSRLFNSPDKNFCREYVKQWCLLKQNILSEICDFVNSYASSEDGVALNASRKLYNKRWGYDYPTVENDAKQTVQWFSQHIPLLGQLIVSLDISTAVNKLPQLKLYGDFGNDYQEGTVTLEMPDGGGKEKLSAKIKWRGGSTNAVGRHKRNYKIKFSEDQQFFDMRTDNNWILDAGQADLFRLRNRIATETWNDMAHKPYYAEKEPEALSGVRGHVVEVFLNDEYRGVYCLTECMDRKQLKLKKFDKNTGEIRGGLWKAEAYSNALMWGTLPYDNTQEKWGAFEVKYPDLDDLPVTDYSTLYNAIDFVVNSSDEEFKAHVHEYFDMPVVIDYYVFLHALNAFDNVGKNMFWAVYDKTQDKKLTPAVWDLDATVGAKWLGELAGPELDVTVNLNLYHRLKLLDVNGFNDAVNCRYHELRKTVLNTDSLVKRYTDYYQLLQQSGAASREEQLWSGDSDVKGETISFDGEIAFIGNWITTHMKHLDEHTFPATMGIAEHHAERVSSHSFYTLSGMQVRQGVDKLSKGIYISNGKKLFVR